MSSYLKRLSYLISLLKEKEFTSDDLLELLLDNNFRISQRQLQRDLKSLQDILADESQLKSFFLNAKKYFYIKTLPLPHHDSTGFNSLNVTYTKFYHQNLDAVKIRTLDLVETAIHQNHTLEVLSVKDDETGDNTDLDDSQFKICPIMLIYHRASYYVGCFNLKTDLVEFFGIKQLVHIKASQPFYNSEHLKHFVNAELDRRFGITKNIDDSIYDIELEFTSATGRFIEDHYWHPSQKITKINGNYIFTMRCGINRELMGWLFQWLYNVKVNKPPLLRDLYLKTVEECKNTYKEGTPFVYRNIFT